VRESLSSRRAFVEHHRGLVLDCLFDNWEHLFDSMIDALQPTKPPPRRRASKQYGANLELLT